MLLKIISAGLVLSFITSCSNPALSKKNESSRETTAAAAPTAQRQVVVTYHPEATQIGYDILKRGGNAFDAFVAATVAEYVLAPGVTSAGGPLFALLFDNRSKTTETMNAEFNDPLDPRQKWDPSHPGTGVLVPGAVAGLEAISKKYGRLSFSEVLKPAILLAENGFPLSESYAAILSEADGAKRLTRSEYGRKTFFKNGATLAKGDFLKLPVVAEFLRRLSQEGSHYVYEGEWKKNFLKSVRAEGGFLKSEDFKNYRAKWEKPWRFSYHGFDIDSVATSGGFKTILALKLLEPIDITKHGHYSSSAGDLETMVRIADKATQQAWLYDQTKIHDDKFVAAAFSETEIDKLRLELHDANVPPSRGTHSYQITVVDEEGNAITGTNTINSLPWESGIFVEGVPLTAANQLPFQTSPGQRRRTDLSMQIGFQQNQVRFTSGTFSASLAAAEFQFLVNIIDYKMSAADAASSLRFGDQAWDPTFQKMRGARWLDPRANPGVVETLRARGLSFVQTGYFDTGLGVIAVVDAKGGKQGAVAPFTGIGFTKEKIVGVGVALDINTQHEFFIVQVIEGSPAARAGLKSGDVIVSAQKTKESALVSLKGKSNDEVLALIRGEAGTSVKMEVRKMPGEITEIEMNRAEIKP